MVTYFTCSERFWESDPCEKQTLLTEWKEIFVRKDISDNNIGINFRHPFLIYCCHLNLRSPIVEDHLIFHSHWAIIDSSFQFSSFCHIHFKIQSNLHMLRLCCCLGKDEEGGFFFSQTMFIHMCAHECCVWFIWKCLDGWVVTRGWEKCI